MPKGLCDEEEFDWQSVVGKAPSKGAAGKSRTEQQRREKQEKKQKKHAQKMQKLDEKKQDGATVANDGGDGVAAGVAVGGSERRALPVNFCLVDPATATAHRQRFPAFTAQTAACMAECGPWHPSPMSGPGINFRSPCP